MDLIKNLKHQEMIEKIEVIHNNLFDSIQKNKKKQNNLASENIFDSVSELRKNISELAKLKKVNEHTLEWINEKLSNIKTVDFETSVEDKLRLHMDDTQRIIKFLKES